MTRKIATYAAAAHGKTLMGAEPLVFHCNYYNYFLQKTVLLDDTLGMDVVLQDAAYASARAQLEAAAAELGLTTKEDRRTLAEHTFFSIGLSTAERTTDISGRGIGMAAVREAFRRLGGDVHVESTAGQGTRVVCRAPVETSPSISP